MGHTSPAGLSGLEGSQRDHRIQHLSEQSVEGWDPHLGRVLSQQSPLGNNHTDQTEQDAQESAFCHHLQGCALGWKSFFSCQRQSLLCPDSVSFGSVADGGSLGVAWRPECDHGSQGLQPLGRRPSVFISRFSPYSLE